MQHQRFDTYEEWDLTLPPGPCRSGLFSLEPVGVGTAWVESLTSYIARLAWAHAVFPGVLMNKMLEPLVQGGHARILHISHGKKTNLLNATGLRARLSVQFLETLTMRSDLRHLTLLAWSEILCLRGLVRATCAWCPQCYEEWRSAGKIIFDPLRMARSRKSPPVWSTKFLCANTARIRPVHECFPRSVGAHALAIVLTARGG